MDIIDGKPVAVLNSARIRVQWRWDCRSTIEQRRLVDYQITIVTARSNANFGVQGALKRGLVAEAADDHIGQIKVDVENIGDGIQPVIQPRDSSSYKMRPALNAIAEHDVRVMRPVRCAEVGEEILNPVKVIYLVKQGFNFVACGVVEQLRLRRVGRCC
jgi:hypothetical protein